MGSQEASHKVKACWTPEFHKLFVSLCLDQLLAGNKPGTYLNKKGWKYVMDEFYERTGVLYDKKQFKNHWDSTKEQWKIWSKLRSSIGDDDLRDKTTKMFRQSHEWWNHYLQAHPEAAQFRYRGLPLADSLDTLFSDGISAGAAAEAPTPSQNTMLTPQLGITLSNFDVAHTQATDATEDGYTEDALDVVVPGARRESPDASQAEFVTCHSSVPRKRKSQDPSTTTQEELRKGTAAGARRAAGHPCEAVESGSTVTSTPPKDRYGIKECVDLLNEMREIPPGSELYMFALDLFVKKEYRELFIVLGASHLRLMWLKRQQRQFAAH